METTGQTINNYFKSVVAQKRKELDNLSDYLTGEQLLTESEMIDKKWYSIVEEHTIQEGPLKLIILAEAALSFRKYFYNSQGTFLDSLRSFWELRNNSDLPRQMMQKRVLLFDIYKYPIPSEFYKKDKNLDLFENKYVTGKLDFLQRKKLIDDNTFFVFRYKNLFYERNLHLKSPLDNLNYIQENKKIVALNETEKPQKINYKIAELLSK